MQKQRQRQDATKTIVKRDRAGNIKRITTGNKEYTFNKQTKTWKEPAPKTKKIKYTPKQEATHFAIKLRNHATPSEQFLNKMLRSIGISFHFQKTIKTDDGYRFADFFIPGLNWIIEVDGGYHNSEEQKARDAIRTKHIVESTGYKIIRFTNNDVENNPEMVIDTILNGIKERFYDVTKIQRGFVPKYEHG